MTEHVKQELAKAKVEIISKGGFVAIKTDSLRALEGCMEAAGARYMKDDITADVVVTDKTDSCLVLLVTEQDKEETDWFEKSEQQGHLIADYIREELEETCKVELRKP